MAKVVIIFYEDQIEIFRGKSLLSKINLTSFGNIKNQEAQEYIKQIISDSGLKISRCYVLYAMDGLITRTIEIPKIKKKEVEKYIKNNIDEYFTVNINDYYFDYKITHENKKNINLFVAAVPRIKVADIISILNLLNININSINVYPDLILSYFINKKGGIGVIDIHENRTYVTLFENGDVFLHSSLMNEFEDNEMFQEYIDNISYFINFYSTRHFGKKIEKLYVIGENLDKVKTTFDSQIDIQKEYGLNSLVKGDRPVLLYPYIKGIIKPNNSIDYNKIINKRDSFRLAMILTIIILVLVTAVWTIATIYVINDTTKEYNLSNLNKEYELYKDIEQKVMELETKKNELQSKRDYLNQIEVEKLDIVDILTQLKNNLPKNIRVTVLTIDKQNVNVTFKIIDTKTLDAAKLVVSLNKIGIFEDVNISQINLDDNVEDINLVLKLKNK